MQNDAMSNCESEGGRGGERVSADEREAAGKQWHATHEYKDERDARRANDAVLWPDVGDQAAVTHVDGRRVQRGREEDAQFLRARENTGSTNLRDGRATKPRAGAGLLKGSWTNLSDVVFEPKVAAFRVCRRESPHGVTDNLGWHERG